MERLVCVDQRRLKALTRLVLQFQPSSQSPGDPMEITPLRVSTQPQGHPQDPRDFV